MKTNVNSKTSIKLFFKKVVHLKPINKNKKVLNQNTDKYIYKGDTRTFDVEKNENETERDDDDNNEADNNGNNNGDVHVADEFDYDDLVEYHVDGDGGDDDSNHFDGATFHGDDSNRNTW